MKKATYEVLATNGKTYKWNFTECEPDHNDYGNGIYIAVVRPSGDSFLLDCRYAKNYDFNRMCVDYLIDYYGENLDELSMDDGTEYVEYVGNVYEVYKRKENTTIIMGGDGKFTELPNAYFRTLRTLQEEDISR